MALSRHLGWRADDTWEACIRRMTRMVEAFAGRRSNVQSGGGRRNGRRLPRVGEHGSPRHVTEINSKLCSS